MKNFTLFCLGFAIAAGSCDSQRNTQKDESEKSEIKNEVPLKSTKNQKEIIDNNTTPKIKKAELPIKDSLFVLNARKSKNQKAGNLNFALDLYRNISQSTKNTNLVFSPYSISTALAMTYAGASGTTKKEMEKTAHFYLEPTPLHSYFAKLGQMTRKTKNFKLINANSIWVDDSLKLKPSFKKTLSSKYKSKATSIDLDSKNAYITINKWVEKMTDNTIKDLLSEDQIQNTKLVLINTIYFKAKWLKKFKAETHYFNNSDGSGTLTPFVKYHGKLKHAYINGVSAVELEYKGKGVSMVLFEIDNLEDFEKNLDAEQIQAFFKELRQKKLRLLFPKFETSHRQNLSNTLKELGMPSAFSQNADFSQMIEGEGKNDELFISDIVHQAQLQASEKGTEASAATALATRRKSKINGKPNYVEVTIDKPFFYLIRDLKTDNILFVGRLNHLK